MKFMLLLNEFHQYAKSIGEWDGPRLWTEYTYGQ